jgi:hypothetical protein
MNSLLKHRFRVVYDPASPGHIAKEEGVPALLTIGWNWLTHPVLRQSILDMRNTFIRHGSNLGSIILTARKTG